MFRQTKALTVTLKILGLLSARNDGGKLQVTWSRRDQAGETNQEKLDSDNYVFFNSSFPIKCNFVIKKTGWREKYVNINLVYCSIMKKSVLHTWKLDLAELYGNTTISKELKCETTLLGNISVDVILFKGLPSEMPPNKPLPASKMPLYHSRSFNTPFPIPNKEVAPVARELPESSPKHGLGSLRRNSMNSSAPPSFIVPPSRDTQASSQFTVGVTNLIQKFKADEFDVSIPDLPEYGKQVAYLFLSQPRGTNYTYAISAFIDSIDERSTTDFETARYCFMCAAYVYALMRSNGLPTKTNISDLGATMVKLFNLCVNFATQDLSAVLTKPDDNASEMLNAVFEHDNSVKFTHYLNSLIIFCIAVKANPIVGKQLLLHFEIPKMRFCDSNLLQKPDTEPLMGIGEAYSYSNTCIYDMPIPPLPDM